MALSPQQLQAFYDTQIPVATQTNSGTSAHKGPGGLAGFLVNNLPSILGGVGLVGGEVLDPFGGGLVTGAGASALGEGIKEKLLGRSLSPKQIAIQAAETAALGGAGKAFKAARTGSKALIGASNPVATDVATDVTKPAFREGLTTQGQQMQARGLGISGGAHISGAPDLFPQDTSRMLTTLRSEKIPLGNANTAAEMVQNKLVGYGSKIDQALAASNKPLGTGDKTGVMSAFKDAIEKLPGVDSAVRKNAENLATNYTKNVKNAVDENNFIRGLDQDVISYIANPDTATAAKQQAATTLRRILRDHVNTIVPGVEKANNAYHALSEIKPYLAKGMREVNQPSGSIFGRIASSGPVQKTEAIVGRGIEKAGTIGKSGSTAPIPSLAGASSIRGQIAGRTVAPILGTPLKTAKKIGVQAGVRALGSAESTSNQRQANPPTDLATALMQSGSPQDNAQAPQSPYPIENLQSDIQRDPKNADTYMKIYQFYQDQIAATQPKPLNSTQQQQANNANSALTDLQSISDMLKQDPSLLVKDVLPTSIGHRLTGTTDYEAARKNIADVIARLRSGAAINASEEKLYNSLLPTAGDSQESAQRKIQRLASLFQSFANPQPAAPDLSSAISQLQ